MMFNLGKTIGRIQKSSLQMLVCYYATKLSPVGLELACAVLVSAWIYSWSRPETYWLIVLRGVSEQLVSACQYCQWDEWFVRGLHKNSEGLCCYIAEICQYDQNQKHLAEMPFGAPWFPGVPRMHLWFLAHKRKCILPSSYWGGTIGACSWLLWGLLWYRQPLAGRGIPMLMVLLYCAFFL